jgi:hypothetical protein
MIFVGVEVMFEHPALSHVISHLRHQSLAAYDRARIIKSTLCVLTIFFCCLDASLLSIDEVIIGVYSDWDSLLL